MMSISAWGLALITKILTFTGSKIAANKRKEKRAREKKIAKLKAKRLKETKAAEAWATKVEAKRLKLAKAEEARVTKSKRVLADIETKLAELLRPVDVAPYSLDSER